MGNSTRPRTPSTVNPTTTRRVRRFSATLKLSSVTSHGVKLRAIMATSQLHLVSRRVKAEEDGEAWRGTPQVAWRQLVRQEADRKGATNSGHQSFHRVQVPHVSELDFADREDRCPVLERV